MKTWLILALITLSVAFISCGSEYQPVPPGPQDSIYVNTYTGTYFGMVTESVSGVDTGGVFKSDTSYAFNIIVQDAGNYLITLIGIENVPNIAVSDSGTFLFEEFNRTIEGTFVDDSLHIFSKSLSGSNEPPQWFSTNIFSFDGGRN